jgi:O-antigen/teichoic acid export membrane protein
VLALIAYTAELTVAIGTAGFTYAVAYYASRRDADRGAILGNTLVVAGGLALVCVPCFALLGDELARALSHGQDAAAWSLVGVVVLAMFLDWCTHNQLIGKLQFGRLNVLLVAAQLTSLGAIVVFVHVAGWGVIGGVLAVISASVVMIAGSLIAVGRLRPSVDFGLMRRLFAYGSRVSVGWVFQLVNYRADVFVLQAFVPLRDVGIYVVAVLVAELALTAGGALSTSVNALVANYEGERRQSETIASSMRHGIILTAATVGGLAVVGGFAIPILFGSDFSAAVTPMYILLPGVFFLGCGQVVTGNLRGVGRPGVSSWLAAGAVVVTLGLDFALIPSHGIDGAALASSIAYIAYGTAGVVALSRVTELPIRSLALVTRRDLRPYLSAVTAIPGVLSRRARRQEASVK